MATSFATLTEIQALPGYIPQVVEGEHRFERLVGYYKFKDRIHCARSQCNQPHAFGYVVQTDKGAIACIGNKCGSNIFGDVFKVAAHELDRELQRLRLEESLRDKLLRLPSVRARAHDLLNRPRGALWLDQAVRSLHALLPRGVFKKLHHEVMQADGRIYVTRLRTDKDPPAPKLSPGQPPSKYIDDHVATLRGIRAIDTPLARSIIETNVLKELDIYAEFTAGWLIDNKPMRKRFDEWERGINGHLSTAEQRLREASVFFTTENLRALALLTTNPDEQARLLLLTFDPASGVVEVAQRAA